MHFLRKKMAVYAVQFWVKIQKPPLSCKHSWSAVPPFSVWTQCVFNIPLKRHQGEPMERCALFKFFLGKHNKHFLYLITLLFKRCGLNWPKWTSQHSPPPPRVLLAHSHPGLLSSNLTPGSPQTTARACLAAHGREWEEAVCNLLRFLSPKINRQWPSVNQTQCKHPFLLLLLLLLLLLIILLLLLLLPFAWPAFV